MKLLFTILSSIMVILTITNPSPASFKEYLPISLELNNKALDIPYFPISYGRKTNFVFGSIYEVNFNGEQKKYLEVLSNFYKITDANSNKKIHVQNQQKSLEPKTPEYNLKTRADSFTFNQISNLYGKLDEDPELILPDFTEFYRTFLNNPRRAERFYNNLIIKGKGVNVFGAKTFKELYQNLGIQTHGGNEPIMKKTK